MYINTTYLLNVTILVVAQWMAKPLSRYRELSKMVEIAKHDMECKDCPNKGHMEWKNVRATGPGFKISA